MDVNKRQSQERKDLKSDGVPADFQGERIFHISVERRQVGERINNGSQPRLISAEIENQHQNKPCRRIVEVDKAQQKDARNEQPPFFLLEAPCGCEAHDQREENIQIENIARKIVRIKSQNPERLRDEGKRP